MGCPSCGAENPSGARFCNSCGAPQAVVCPGCGNGNAPASRFCNACGGPLAAATTLARSDAPSPQSYTPKHLAEKILASRAGLEGERKQVTVLFADVVGSTELIRDRDPEEAQRLLDGAVQQMMTAVHRYEGTVSRLMGDGLMAMFGAPVAHEDHAVRACYAALAMLEGVRGYAEEAMRAHGAAISIRVGLNSGEVVVRLISDDLHMDYTAMGQTVHLASRLEGLANAGTTLLSPSTLALTEGFVDVRPRGPRSVKGLDDPLPVYELIGAGAARTRLQAAAARGLTPFIGRDDERAIVDRALARTVSGLGQVVALVGEPGVGKSRLVYEVTRAATAADWLVLASGALSYGTATPYLPVVDLLKSYAVIQSGDDVTTMRNRLTGRLLSLDPALDAILAPLLVLLDLPAEDVSWTALDPPRRRRATLDAIKRLLLRQSEEQPVLLVLEDLHWVDSETQALLDELVESLVSARMMLLVNYRPEYTHTWGNKSYYTQARVDPLESGSAEQFLHSQLGDDAALIPLKQHLIERTGGNPLFLEESVRSLVETGVLVGQRGGYTLTRDVDDVSVPATVQVILAARIDRLDPEAKRLLQTAAVIGKDVPIDLLRAIADVDSGAPDDLHRILSRLQSAELLYTVRLFPEPEYTFKHALTHEVAYGSLLQERRRTLHGQIVEAIERLHPDRLDEQVERLAHHALQAERWEQAADYCHQAGDRARSRSAYRAAAVHLEQALAALTHVAPTRERTEQAIDIRFGLRSALRLLSEVERIPQLLQEAATLAEQLGDRRRLAWATYHLSNFYFHAGQHQRAVDIGRQVAVIAKELGDIDLQVAGHTGVALPTWSLGAYRQAAEEFIRAIEISNEDWFETFSVERTGPDSIISLANVAWCLAELGAFDEGKQYEAEAIRLAEEVGQPYGVIGVVNRSSLVAIRQGDPCRIIPRLGRALDMARTQDLPLLVAPATARLGAAYALAGRLDDALPLLERTAALFDSGQAGAEGVSHLSFVAEGYFRAGRIDAATDVASRALTKAIARHERGTEAWLHRILGEIAAHCQPSDDDEAEQHYLASLVLAEELEMRPLQAHCRLGLGKLYRRTGRLDEARAELATAIAMLREMGMTFWLPEAEMELAAASR